jgi:ATP-dependent Lon protease
MPAENEKDLEDILEAVREEMTFHFVEHMDQVLAHSLVRSEDAEVPTPTGETEARLDPPSLAH